MPKKTEEKNTKGTKKVTKSSTSKKATKKVTPKKVTENKKVVKVPETKVEVKEVVTKKVEKKGNKDSLFNNTPFVITLCACVLLVAALIFTLCMKRVPTTSNGDEIVATVKGKKITANDLYLSLKDAGGKEQLLSIIDEYIAEQEVEITKADEEYAQEVVDYYVEYAEYYKTDLESFLTNYVGLTGISTEEEFFEFVLKDYKKTLAVQKYIGEKADEDELKEYYEKNFSDKLTVKHILIEVDSEAEDADKAEEEAYNKAVKLIKKLKETDEDKLDKKFEELAKNNSDDTGTYSNGGLVENFTKAEVDEAFYDAAAKLENGKYTKEPVKSSFGYHIILKVSSTPREEYDKIVEDVKKAYAESELKSDSNLLTLKWAELRDEYKLSIKDDYIKETYEEQIKNIKNTKTEE